MSFDIYSDETFTNPRGGVTEKEVDFLAFRRAINTFALTTPKANVGKFFKDLSKSCGTTQNTTTFKSL